MHQAELLLFPTDSPETVELLVTPQDPLVEGDNMTLKCVADGNPAPTSFNFHLKVTHTTCLDFCAPQKINK